MKVEVLVEQLETQMVRRSAHSLGNRMARLMESWWGRGLEERLGLCWVARSVLSLDLQTE